jgi:Ulp1 family protease
MQDHWILIEIKIKEQTINVWDSMRKELAMYQDIIDMIQK